MKMQKKRRGGGGVRSRGGGVRSGVRVDVHVELKLFGGLVGG